MPAAVTLRRNFSADDLRHLAKRTKDNNQSRRLLSLAAVPEGMRRKRLRGSQHETSPGVNMRHAFTFAPLCAAIGEKGGHYFFFVKGNQPELQAELAYAFGDDSPHKAGQLPRPKHRNHRSVRSRKVCEAIAYDARAAVLDEDLLC